MIVNKDPITGKTGFGELDESTLAHISTVAATLGIVWGIFTYYWAWKGFKNRKLPGFSERKSRRRRKS